MTTLNFASFTNYPTGKTILALIPRQAVTTMSGAQYRGFIEIVDSTTGFLFGTPDIQFRVYVDCVYK